MNHLSFYNKRALITGGLGFIGSHLAHCLVDLGAEVTLVDSMVPDYGGNLFNIQQIKNKIKLNFSDVRDEHSLGYLVQDQDYIFSLAGQVSHIDSMKDPYTDLEINTKSQLSILEACRKNNPDVRIVYTSTRQVYGRGEYLPLDELHPLHPVDVNGINKIAGESYYLIYHEVYGIHSVILRLTNTYGPHQLVKHNRQGFMGWFIRKIMNGENIELYGDGEQLRDFNYVSDVVDALVTCITCKEAYGHIFNLGGGRPISLKALIEIMIKVYGSGKYTTIPFPEEKKKIDIGSIYLDANKIKTFLGWRPKVGLEEGLAKTFEFYRTYGSYYW